MTLNPVKGLVSMESSLSKVIQLFYLNLSKIAVAKITVKTKAVGSKWINKVLPIFKKKKQQNR